MQTFESQFLIDQLESEIRRILATTASLRQLPVKTLETSPKPGAWSVAQVLEHLNWYAAYYNTALESSLHLHQTQPKTQFKPGWLGNYFTNMMQPAANNSIKNKIKAPKTARPSQQPDADKMITTFIAHQHQLLQILQVVRTANLESIRIPISISKWIRLKLGDTCRFIVAHEVRHFVQIENTLQQVSTH